MGRSVRGDRNRPVPTGRRGFFFFRSVSDARPRRQRILSGGVWCRRPLRRGYLPISHPIGGRGIRPRTGGKQISRLPSPSPGSTRWKRGPLPFQTWIHTGWIPYVFDSCWDRFPSTLPLPSRGMVDLVGSRPRRPGEGSPLNPDVHWTSWDPTGSNAPFDRCSCSLAAASIAAHFPRPKRHADRRLRTHEGRPSHCQPQERNQTRQRRRARRREGSICGRSGKAQVDRTQARSQHAVAHLRWKHRWTAQKGTGERKSGVERKERRKTKEGTTEPRTGRTRETAPIAQTEDREWPGGFDWGKKN